MDISVLEILLQGKYLTMVPYEYNSERVDNAVNSYRYYFF